MHDCCNVTRRHVKERTHSCETEGRPHVEPQNIPTHQTDTIKTAQNQYQKLGAQKGFKRFGWVGWHVFCCQHQSASCHLYLLSQLVLCVCQWKPRTCPVSRLCDRSSQRGIIKWWRVDPSCCIVCWREGGALVPASNILSQLMQKENWLCLSMHSKRRVKKAYLGDVFRPGSGAQG